MTNPEQIPPWLAKGITFNKLTTKQVRKKAQKIADQLHAYQQHKTY